MRFHFLEQLAIFLRLRLVKVEVKLTVFILPILLECVELGFCNEWLSAPFFLDKTYGSIECLSLEFSFIWTTLGACIKTLIVLRLFFAITAQFNCVSGVNKIFLRILLFTLDRWLALRWHIYALILLYKRVRAKFVLILGLAFTIPASLSDTIRGDLNFLCSGLASKVPVVLLATEVKV